MKKSMIDDNNINDLVIKSIQNHAYKSITPLLRSKKKMMKKKKMMMMMMST
jgi:hypothetical protein